MTAVQSKPLTEEAIIALFDQSRAQKSARNYGAALQSLKTILYNSPAALSVPSIWNFLFNAPSWFVSTHEMDEYLDYAAGIMVAIDKVCQRMPAQEAARFANAFVQGAQFRHTVHNDQNLKDFMLLRAKLYQYALAGMNSQQDYRFPARRGTGGKMKVGLLFKHLANDPETTSVMPFIEGVKSDDIEVILLVGSRRADPECLAHAESVADRIDYIPEQLAPAITAIRQQDLDILIFGNDITAKASLFAYLSFFRLARRTACCVSTLVTTASPYMDLYLGAHYYQSRGCAGEFHERFCALSDPGFAFWFPDKVPQKVAAFERNSLGVDPNTVLLVSGANHTKLHTPLLQVWASILTRCPDTVLVLYPFPPHFGPAREQVVARVMQDFTRFGIPESRLRILPSLPGRNAVKSMLSQMDLGLDSFPYTGVTTVVDAVEVGLPTVTYAGSTLRTAQGAAILNAVQADSLIASSLDEYVEKVVALVQQPEALQLQRDKLLQAPKPFLEPLAFGRAAADFYRGLYKEIQNDN